MAQEFYKELLDEEDYIPSRRKLLRQRAGLRSKDSTVSWCIILDGWGRFPKIIWDLHQLLFRKNITTLDHNCHLFPLLNPRFHLSPLSRGIARGIPYAKWRCAITCSMLGLSSVPQVIFNTPAWNQVEQKDNVNFLREFLATFCEKLPSDTEVEDSCFSFFVKNDWNNMSNGSWHQEALTWCSMTFGLNPQLAAEAERAVPQPNLMVDILTRHDWQHLQGLGLHWGRCPTSICILLHDEIPTESQSKVLPLFQFDFERSNLVKQISLNFLEFSWIHYDQFAICLNLTQGEAVLGCKNSKTSSVLSCRHGFLIWLCFQMCDSMWSVFHTSPISGAWKIDSSWKKKGHSRPKCFASGLTTRLSCGSSWLMDILYLYDQTICTVI